MNSVVDQVGAEVLSFHAVTGVGPVRMARLALIDQESQEVSK
jgi:hypothetical protein